MAGWDVTVYLQDPSDQRPLQIVGVRAVDLREAAIGPTSEEWPDVVLIEAGLYCSQEWVRRHAAVATRRPTTEVLLWGGEKHVDLSTKLRQSEHRISIAAHAFKTSAISAAGESASSVGQTERLLCKKAVLTIASLTSSSR
jgi:hypothetical protein